MKRDSNDPSMRMGTVRRWLLAVLVLLVLVPRSASAEMNCDTHELGGITQAPDALGEAHERWESSLPGNDDCPHCTPKHCAVTPACGATLAWVLTAPFTVVDAMPLSLGIPVPDTRLPAGLDTQPPTPPPQISA
jgi:hypothetical protein